MCHSERTVQIDTIGEKGINKTNHINIEIFLPFSVILYFS